MDRSFVIESVHHGKSKLRPHQGRYISKTPSGAAKKMFTTVSNGKYKTLKITCRESTQGSAKKSYTYRVTRVKNETVVVLDDVEVTFKYSTKIKAV